MARVPVPRGPVTGFGTGRLDGESPRLVQPFHIAEPVTGVPGLSVPPDEAVAGLARLLDRTTRL